MPSRVSASSAASARLGARAEVNRAVKLAVARRATASVGRSGASSASRPREPPDRASAIMASTARPIQAGPDSQPAGVSTPTSSATGSPMAAAITARRVG
jgi:hypothetical protein